LKFTKKKKEIENFQIVELLIGNSRSCGIDH